MEQGQLNWISNFIWGIADDVLRDLSPNPVLNADASVKHSGLDNHGMATVFEELVRRVHNGSSLFTGDAGQGESNIRRWIIENDWLEAIVALPLNMFYNTGIATYIWVLTNRNLAHTSRSPCGRSRRSGRTSWRSRRRPKGCWPKS